MVFYVADYRKHEKNPAYFLYCKGLLGDISELFDIS